MIGGASALKMTGTSGELRVGYQVAAQLSRWTLDGDMVSTEGTKLDSFWIEMGATPGLRLRVGRSWWAWAQVAVVGHDPLVVRVLGSPTKRSAE
jgi:hypothetical protein